MSLWTNTVPTFKSDNPKVWLLGSSSSFRMVRTVGVQACWTSATAIWGAGHGGDDCHYGDRGDSASNGDDGHHGDCCYGYRDHDDVDDGDNHYGDSVNDHHSDGKVGGGVDRRDESVGDTDNNDDA